MRKREVVSYHFSFNRPIGCYDLGIIILSMNSPATLSFQHQDRSSRLWALLTILFLKFVFLIPHFLALGVLSFVVGIFIFIGALGTLFTGQYPKFCEDFIVGFYRWHWRLTAFLYCASSSYPPFGFSSGKYPADLDFKHEEHNSRLLALATVLMFPKIILVIPHIVIMMFLSIPALLIFLLAPFAVLFTGRNPQSFENYLVGFQRWTWRYTAYFLGLTKQYPPFSFQ